MSIESIEEYLSNQKRNCGSCKFHDGLCCMHALHVTIIFDEEKSAEHCKYYEFGF